ncbi:baculoviral IAP repeat-containing protein 6 [Planoprotostelium fungivorum]|uniref:Baculoviral IAP repeat-containing protein 6 n=1 Tax=Planoprotostelium fungivorum TaxID=1890364 RepID=A0A2P6ND81_9EUKA|nr:baculoviral IAP repeat-containing protein 6 [Planoprotostelium fungivorum]
MCGQELRSHNLICRMEVLFGLFKNSFGGGDEQDENSEEETEDYTHEDDGEASSPKEPLDADEELDQSFTFTNQADNFMLPAPNTPLPGANKTKKKKKKKKKESGKETAKEEITENEAQIVEAEITPEKDVIATPIATSEESARLLLESDDWELNLLNIVDLIRHYNIVRYVVRSSHDASESKKSRKKRNKKTKDKSAKVEEIEVDTADIFFFMEEETPTEKEGGTKKYRKKKNKNKKKSQGVKESQNATSPTEPISHSPKEEISTDKKVEEEPAPVKLLPPNGLIPRLLSCCTDASQSIRLREAALVLLHCYVDEGTPVLSPELCGDATDFISQLLTTNVVRGNGVTSQLTGRLIQRVDEPSEWLMQIVSQYTGTFFFRDGFENLVKCTSGYSLEQLILLHLWSHPEDSKHRDNLFQLLLEFLGKLGSRLGEKKLESTYYSTLRSRYNLFGYPLEAGLFQPMHTSTPAENSKAPRNELEFPLLTLRLSTSKTEEMNSKTMAGGLFVYLDKLKSSWNEVVLDMGSISLLTSVEIKVDMPNTLWEYMTVVEAGINGNMMNKIRQFTQISNGNTSKESRTKKEDRICFFLDTPQLCRFIKISIRVNDTPNYRKKSRGKFPSTCLVSIAARGIRNVLRDTSTVEGRALTIQNKMSVFASEFEEKRGELCSEMETTKGNGGNNSDVGHKKAITSQFKEVNKAQIFYYYARVILQSMREYLPLKRGTGPEESEVAASSIELETSTDVMSSDHSIDQWLCFSRIICDTLVSPPDLEYGTSHPTATLPPSPEEVMTSSTPNASEEVTSSPAPDEKRRPDVNLTWDQAAQLFETFCVLGVASSDLREKVSTQLIASSLILLNREWLPLFFTHFLSKEPKSFCGDEETSKSLTPGGIVQREIFELVHNMIRPDDHKIYTGQLFQLLSDCLSNETTIDTELFSWTLLMLSRIIQNINTKTKAQSFSPDVPPLLTLYRFLQRSFDLPQYKQESFLMAIYVLRKVVTHVDLKTVREEMLDDPSFYHHFLLRCTKYSNPFIHSAVIELLETILNPATFPEEEVRADIEILRGNVRREAGRMLRDKNEPSVTQFLLDVINLLATPLIVTEGQDTITVDNETCSFLLDLLQHHPLSISTVGLWWVVLSLVRRSDPVYILNHSAPLVQVFSSMLSSTDELQGMMCDVFGELVKWLFTQSGSGEICTQMFGKLMNIMTKISQQMEKENLDTKEGTGEERRVKTGSSECVLLCRMISAALIVKNDVLLTRPIPLYQLVQVLNCVAVTTRVVFPSLEGKTEGGHDFDGTCRIGEHLLKLITSMSSDPTNESIKGLMTEVCRGDDVSLNHIVQWLGEQKSLTVKPRSAGTANANEREEWKAAILKVTFQLANFGGNSTRNHVLGVAFKWLKSNPSASLAQLCQSLITNDDVADHFVRNLNGFHILAGQLVAGQTTTPSNVSGNTGAIHLTSQSLIHLQSTTNGNPPNNGTNNGNNNSGGNSFKTSKPGAMENFSALAQLGTTDTQLLNIFKDFTGNGTVWTKKCPTNTKDSEFRIKIKLPFPILLKQWYLENNEISEWPTYLTVCAGLAASPTNTYKNLKPCGRFPFKKADSGILKTFQFNVNQGAIARYITLKIQHDGNKPIALTRIHLRGYNASNYMYASTESTDSTLSPKPDDVAHIPASAVHSCWELLSGCLSNHPNTAEHIASQFSSEGADGDSEKLLYQLVSQMSTEIGYVEDIVHHLACHSSFLASKIIRYLLNGETNVYQAQLLGRLMTVTGDARHSEDVEMLTRHVFQLFESAPAGQAGLVVSPSVVPLMNSLTLMVRGEPPFERPEKIRVEKEGVLALYECAKITPEGSQKQIASLKLLSALLSADADLYRHIVDDLLHDLSSDRNLPEKSMRCTAILASVSTACADILMDSGIVAHFSQRVQQPAANPEALRSLFDFFTVCASSSRIKTWHNDKMLGYVLDLWSTVKLRPETLVPYLNLLTCIIDGSPATQETVGHWLADMLEREPSLDNPSQCKLLEALLCTRDYAYVTIRDKSYHGTSSHGGQQGRKSLSLPLEFDANNAGNATVDGANVKSSSLPATAYIYTTIKANQGFSSGYHYWEVEVLGTSGNLFIGVAEQEHPVHHYLGQFSANGFMSFGLLGSSSSWFYSASADTQNSKQWGSMFSKGDVIGVELDFEAGTLSYFRNGESLGEAYSGGFGDGELFPSVTLHAPGDHAAFLYYSQASKPYKKKPTIVDATEGNQYDRSSVMALDSSHPLFYHRTTTIYCVPVGTTLGHFKSVVKSLNPNAKKMELYDGKQVLKGEGQYMQSLLQPSGERKNHPRDIVSFDPVSDIIDLQLATSETDTPEEAQPPLRPIHNRLVQVLIERNTFSLLVQCVYNSAEQKMTQKLSPDSTASVSSWLSWLDLLRIFIRISDYAFHFLNDKRCRSLFITAIRGKFVPEEMAGNLNKNHPIDHEEIKSDMFHPVMMALRRLLRDHTSLDTERNVRKGMIENTLLERFLVKISNLSGVEPNNPERFLEVTSHDKDRTAKKNKEGGKSKANAKTFWAKGTGYGTSYDGETQWDHQQYTKTILAKAKQQAQMMSVLGGFLSLPTDRLSRAVDMDYLSELLRDSSLVPTLISYLRNDSLLDLMRQSQLYAAVFDLIGGIASHAPLVYLLSTHEDETSSICELINKLHVMAELFIRTSKKAEKLSDVDDEKEKHKKEEDMTEMNVAHCILLVSKLVNDATSDVKQMKVEKTEKTETPSVDASETNATETDAIPGGVIDDLQVIHQKNKDIRDVYCSEMRSLQFGEMTMTDESGEHFHHHYASRIEQETAGMATKFKRLVQEISSLSNGLPLSPESSVFVRIDAERMDVIKGDSQGGSYAVLIRTVLITGPAFTPYSNGCFQFDVYCPTDYPSCPPVINLETTGSGLVRFNPNLYTCGKVCLSLLGTWHSTNQNEQWNENSTILQVLVSIQSLIFVEQPFFNEPGFENLMGTQNGDKQSRDYNQNIRLQTLKWAMLHQLKNPPAGFEDVIRSHFKLKRESVLSEVEVWVKESPGGKQQQMRDQLEELKKEMDAL